jgi:branched-subunit amino acid ABC-type transport system permease component
MAFLDEPEQGIIDQATVSPRPTGIRWGLILGLVSAATSLLFTMTDMIDFANPQMFSLPNLVNWAVLIGIYYYAFTQHRDNELGGHMTLGRAMLLGFWIALISGIITAVYMYLYTTVINPDFTSQIIDGAIEKAEKKGQDGEAVRSAMESMSFFFSPTYMSIMAVVGSLLMGALFSLIIGLIIRRDPPRPF